MRFFSLSLNDVYQLDHEEFLMLSDALHALEAQESISLLRVQDWPNMKKEARTKLYRDLNKIANPSILREEPKALTTQDLAALLNGR
jgi:hypothetical protein